MRKRSILLLILMFSTLLLFGRGGKEVTKGESSVLVYITGVVAGSPPYTAMAEGALEFAALHENVKVKVYEAGFNQAEWEEQLTALVATGEYDLVLGSNPSLPEICEKIAKKFPSMRFIITDAFFEGHPQIKTFLFNQYEQSLYLGYLAGLVTTSQMPLANKELKVGFIAAQEYPLLNRHMVPGFLQGAQMVNPNITLDFRVVGNWFDANKVADLATSMINAKVDVFAIIAGGASQGLFKVAQTQGAYIVFHNEKQYDAAPGYVVGCGSMEQKKLVKEILEVALTGEIEYGEATIVGLKEGYLGFFFDDPSYLETLPQEIRDKFELLMAQLREGKIAYTLPKL
ncbi:MAG: BMP family ABC transporter substrate-binding protein [Sphaerochaetaceae bacterium]|jgi:basic membrane lipoprotein Med (substrate-binding protein (PBP1-ABC) superfamily)|nr:BMP family ABC transporter substrate-binding protein [Sphaerochaetaceae bacterium]HHU88487.1 BMP family ABC transporter substrate-binding protein [Spirochaetales bacterium]